MSKDEALWVVIRAAGLVFLVLTVVSLTSLLSVGTYWLYLSDVGMVVDETSPVLSGKVMAEKTAKTLLSNRVGEFFLYGISAFYFMRKGNLVHRFVSK
ncbi:hypothetical protein [Halopseudomonas salegens]|uniref:Uncharacterized protein n=1 Tax=Halopseudomonas salegens TaxID=1434072 RepID=A0A1H2G7K9_9GAMM|nr:hypothetical protein [Halopseudomonas salegens]SDU15716.1 hypothetical protein SAMN05216210_2107 [Halopseudomonas salegens]